MNDRFLQVDIEAITFHGLSKPVDRQIAFLNTLLIWLSVFVVLLLFTAQLNPNGAFAFCTLTVMSLTVLDYIFNARFLPIIFAKWLINYLPIATLYKKDMQVIDNAKLELFSLAEQVHFEDYLIYAKINPDIRSEDSIRVMMIQKKGCLSQWTKHPGDLKKLANLVYQIYLVESFIQDDLEQF